MQAKVPYDPVVIEGKPIGRLKASWLLFKESWRFLRADTELLWIPIITSLLNIALFGVLITAGVLYGAFSTFDETKAATTQELLFMLVIYLVATFTMALAQAAIVNTVLVRVKGGNATLGQSIAFAFSHWISLLCWSAISSTVGVILNAVSERSQMLGRIVTALLGSAWAILTYFVIPVMVVEKQSPFASIKKSALVFRQTWGETFVSNISLGLTFLVAHVLLFASIFGLGVLAIVLENPIALMVLVGVYIVAVMGLLIISSVLEGVLKTLLYVYASEGAAPANFNQMLLEKMLARTKVAEVPPPPTSTSL